MADVFVQLGKMQALPGKAVSKEHAKGIDKVMKAAAAKSLTKAKGVTGKGSGKPKFTLAGLLIALKVDTKTKKTSCEVTLTVYDGAKGVKLGGSRKSAEVAGVAKGDVAKCVGKVMDTAVADAAGQMTATSSGAIGIALTVNAKNCKPLKEPATKARMTKAATAAVSKMGGGRSVVTKHAKYGLTVTLKSVKIDAAKKTTSCEVSAGVGPPNSVPKKSFIKTTKFSNAASLKDAEECVEMCVKVAVGAAKGELK